MPVFKATIRSLKTYYINILVYFLVFAVFGTMTSRMNSGSTDSLYEDVVLDVAVIDHDHSTFSEALVNYLDTTQHLVDANTTKPRELNDNVRFDIYDYALVIPEGFETSHELEYYTSGNSASGYLMTEKIQSYVQDIVVYLNSGYPIEEAIALTDEQIADVDNTSATILDETGTHQRSYFTGMFTFNGYTLLMMLCISVGSVMTYMKEKDVNNRITVSGMSFVKRNIGLFLSVLVIGILLTSASILFTIVTNLGDSAIHKIGYFSLNTFVLMFVGLGIAYFISSITKNDSIINMLSNMIVLSMAFLCGVFIQTELLDDTIVAISHFLPLYWYVQATNYINAHALGEMFSTDFLTYLAMQLVFAAIFFVAGLIISRKKEQYAI